MDKLAAVKKATSAAEIYAHVGHFIAFPVRITCKNRGCSAFFFSTFISARSWSRLFSFLCINLRNKQALFLKSRLKGYIIITSCVASWGGPPHHAPLI